MQLLKIEWIKIKRYRTFWILTGIFVVLYLLNNIGVSNVVKEMNNQPVKISRESYAFPYVWNTMGYIYGWFVFFLSFFVIISITNEYSFKTQRQHIIDGMHRIDFLHAKALLILAISLASTLFYTILCMIFGFLFGGTGVFEQAMVIAYVFIYTVNYLSFAALLALFLKKTGLTIILFFTYILIEIGISTYINLKFSTQVGNLLPLQCSDELLPLRSMSFLKSMARQATSSTEISPYLYFGISIAFIFLYYFIARRKMLNSDL